MSSPGRKKYILFTLMLFGPGILLFVLSRGKQNFNYLEVLGETPNYQLYDLDSNLISPETNEKDVLIFTTIQNSCYDNSDKSCNIYPYFIEQFFYDEFKSSPKKYSRVKIYSIVTDAEGNPVYPDSILIEAFKKYDPNLWTLALGDPKGVYGFEKKGMNFTEIRNEEDGKLEFPRMGMVVSESRKIRAIRPLNSEAFVRELSERFRMVLKEKDIKEYNENR
ncbi:MAG: hypothetical protein KDC84_03295 [Crocinitomicaceae bacterium]|nr:hypothetical protein [Crocinitomicaceae bacterium]